jgi:hypothetical protein
VALIPLQLFGERYTPHYREDGHWCGYDHVEKRYVFVLNPNMRDQENLARKFCQWRNEEDEKK